MNFYTGFGDFFVGMMVALGLFTVLGILISIVSFVIAVVNRIKGKKVNELGCAWYWKDVYKIYVLIIFGIFAISLVAFPGYHWFSYANRAIEKVLVSDFDGKIINNGDTRMITNCVFTDLKHPLTIADEVHIDVESITQAEDFMTWDRAKELYVDINCVGEDITKAEVIRQER